jgi:hypothetical protein
MTREPPKKRLDELHMMMTLLRPVRNNVIHAVIMYAEGGAPIFELHGRQLTKEEVFATEEPTNYAARAAWVLRHELGTKTPTGLLARCRPDLRYHRFLRNDARS